MMSAATLRAGIAAAGWIWLATPSDVRVQPAPRPVTELCAAGLEDGYNLDHTDALRLFQQAIALDPDDPTPHRLAAASLWTQALFEQGAITAEDFLGQTKSNIGRRPPSPALADGFRTEITRAFDLAEARVESHPRDADAHFQFGAAISYQATWTATVEGRVVAAVRNARRAFNEHQRALELDPSRTDAALIVGMYRYTVSTLSAPKRFVARLIGMGGDHDQGLELVERAARVPSDVQTNARFTLIVMYNRESRWDDALAVIHELQARYPRNRLLWLEEANTLLRAHRFADARRAVDAGLAKLAADQRPRAFGEETRWQDARRAAEAGGRP